MVYCDGYCKKIYKKRRKNFNELARVETKLQFV